MTIKEYVHCINTSLEAHDFIDISLSFPTKALCEVKCVNRTNEKHLIQVSIEKENNNTIIFFKENGILLYKETPTIYYLDELKDEFSTAEITAKEINEKYDYLGSFGRKIGRFLIYRLILTPFACLYLKINFSQKIIGKEKLKSIKNGSFIYGNHTQPIGDACMPTLLSFPKGAYVIVHPNNISMPGLGKIVPLSGGLPLPGNLGATRNFTNAIKKLISKNKIIAIYPEAHIWPFYTGIRHFSQESFYYPVTENAPVFCFTNTYQKKSNGIKMTTYIDGPFYAPDDLNRAAKKLWLRDKVFEAMSERSQNSNIDIISYKPMPSAERKSQ